MNNSWPFDGEIKPVEKEKFDKVIYTKDRNAVHGNQSGCEWLESHHADSIDIRRAFVQTFVYERAV